jgi:hypothetical protein
LRHCRVKEKLKVEIRMSVDISMGMNMSALRLGWAHNLLKLGYGQRKERLECGKGAFIKRSGREEKKKRG